MQTISDDSIGGLIREFVENDHSKTETCELVEAIKAQDPLLARAVNGADNWVIGVALMAGFALGCEHGNGS